jgi:pimeloyl-ACP methyl ester carboxylesterase
MTTSRVTHAASLATGMEQKRRGCLFVIGRGLKWLGIAFVVLIILGVSYQLIATALDQRAYAPHGTLHSVSGRQMHMVCAGEGSPAVILEAGGAAESRWWYHVQNLLAQHTRVCAYDRAGHGWSDAATGARDGVTIARELRLLLEEADVAPPYVAVGHSFGAVWARIFAAQYPTEVVGLVLVDSTLLIPSNFATQVEFDQWRTSLDALKAVEWGLYRVGLVRLTAYNDFASADYPSDVAAELTAMRSRSSTFDVDYAEQVAAGWELRQAANAANDFGDLPLLVLWASETHTVMQAIPTLREAQNALADLSSSTTIQIVQGAGHGSILGSEAYARQVSEAILALLGNAQEGA